MYNNIILYEFLSSLHTAVVLLYCAYETAITYYNNNILYNIVCVNALPRWRYWVIFITHEERIPHGRVSWSHVGRTHTQSRTGFRPYYVEKIWQPFSDDGDSSREIPAVRRVRVATDKSRIIGVYPSVHHPFCVYALRLDLHTNAHTHTHARALMDVF